MSSASLAVASHTHPDRARIAAISAALALNLAALLLASRPLAPAPFAAVRQLAPVALVRFIDPPAVAPPPPPITLKPLPHPPTAPPVRPQALPLSPPALPLAAPSGISAPTALPPARTTADAPAGRGVAAPVEASLAYRAAPLQFPLQALRQRMHGLVLLRVLVDETGRPVEVQVERSSGYPLLDHSAREQVLAGWRFQPAVLNGRRVRAWARVPVSFNLRPL